MNVRLILKRIAAYILTAIIYGFVIGIASNILNNFTPEKITLLIILIIYYVLIAKFGEIGKKIMKLKVLDANGLEVNGFDLLKSSTLVHLLTINTIIIPTLIQISSKFAIFTVIPTIYLILFIIGKDIWHSVFGYQIVED